MAKSPLTVAHRAVVLLAVCCLVTAPAWAQTSPEATIDPVGWLKQHLGGAACVVYDVGPSPFRMEHVTENTEVTFDGCRMTLHQAGVRGPQSEVRTFRVPLGALDADAISVIDGFLLPEGWSSTGDVPTHTIRISAPGDRRLIDSRVETFDGRAPREYATHAVDFLVRHQENADAIVRALRLAIAGCRGR